MKKSLIALALLFSCSYTFAQTEFDALKYVQTDINGTARYMGMAGAFGALGGDASAIKDNPAGLGIYRRSELSGTLSTLSQTSTSNWNNAKSNGDLYKMGYNNFSYIIATPTYNAGNTSEGLLSSNFSISFNRLKNFERSISLKGAASTSSMTQYIAGLTNGISELNLQSTSTNNPFGNTSIPWLSILAYEGYLINPTTSGGSQWNSLLGNSETVIPTYRLYEKGHFDEYSIGWAGNFSNKLFLGATLNLKVLNYSAFTSYSETFGAGGDMVLTDTITTKGKGFNLKIGAIYCPTDYLRLGFSVHSPALLILKDNYYSKLNFNTLQKGYISTPGDGYSDYQIQTPLELDASAAFIAGDKGLISVEYDFLNYNGTRLKSDAGDAESFDLENESMRANIYNVNTIKIGGEYKLTPNFSLRAGYAYSSAATNPDANKLIRYNTLRTDLEYFKNNSTNYITAGFGYRESSWFIDCAYVNKRLDETFYPYYSVDVSPASVITTNNDLIVTLGIRF